MYKKESDFHTTKGLMKNRSLSHPVIDANSFEEQESQIQLASDDKKVNIYFSFIFILNLKISDW